MEKPIELRYDTEEKEYTFRTSLVKRKEDLYYLYRHKFRFIPVAIIGLLFGLFLAWYWPVTYTSRITFVVDDSKAGGGSMISALAGQFGLDLGAMSIGGVLAGDNVTYLLKSEKLIKETLLTPYDDADPRITLADKYSQASKLNKKWKKYSPDKSSFIRFPADRSGYSRIQDSLLQDMTIRIIENDFSVSKPDKKLSFFEASATMRDEKLSQFFCTRLIETSTRFYKETKTQKLRANVASLQRRADSLSRVLNSKTYSASAANRISLDANPAYPTTKVNAELQGRDKMVLSTIYSEVVKNLEANKTMLMQETPTIQIVDVSEYPLKKNRLKYLKTSVLAVMVSIFLYAAFLLFAKGMAAAKN